MRVGMGIAVKILSICVECHTGQEVCNRWVITIHSTFRNSDERNSNRNDDSQIRFHSISDGDRDSESSI